MTDLLNLIDLAREDLALNAHRSDAVVNWFGEHKGERLAGLRADCVEVLRCALARPSDEPVRLDANFRGDWIRALIAGWALARLGRAHRLAPPFVSAEPVWRKAPSVKGEVSTLGGGDLTVFQGPLSLSGTVRISGMVLVVGAFDVDGLLSIGGNPGDCLLVVGNERVTALEVGWGHFVMGSLDAELLRWSYNAIHEGLLCVTGETRAALILTERRGSMDEDVAANADNPLRALLVPHVEGPLDIDHFCALVGSRSHRLTADVRETPRELDVSGG